MNFLRKLWFRKKKNRTVAVASPTRIKISREYLAGANNDYSYEVNIDNYHDALKRIEQIWDSKPGTKNGKELDLLVSAVEKYEKQTFPIPPARESYNE